MAKARNRAKYQRNLLNGLGDVDRVVHNRTDLEQECYNGGA